MSDFLSNLAASPPVIPREALVRLLGALVLGWIVSLIYQYTRPGKYSVSVRSTLVLLAPLIAIVTQVVGGNTARAFSLVGALSIVRFRTVVQDTQDTAFVIFAVVMGMAAGAGDLWISLIGLAIVGGAAFGMRTKAPDPVEGALAGYVLNLRVGLGHDIESVAREAFKAHTTSAKLASMETVKQGTAVEATYRLAFKSDGSAEALLKALNRTEGVQNVHLQDAAMDDDDARPRMIRAIRVHVSETYRLHRRMLQTFVHEGPDAEPRRWLLKSPFHVSTLPTLFAEYPDARVVHTHRDPRRFLASLVSILGAIRFMRSDAVDVAALAGIMQMTYRMFLEGTIDQRISGEIPDDRIVDSHFTTLMRDPVASLLATYERLELAWPNGHDRRITDYLAAKPKGKHGEHSYSLADVGLDEASVAADFARYTAHYGIEPEDR